MGLHRALAALLVLALGAAASEDFSQVAKLVASDGAQADHFGFKVASSNNYVVVTAHDNDDAGTSSGSAYIYRTVDGVTTQVAKLVADDAQGGDMFGVSVDADGDTVVIGATQNDDAATNAGAAYIFKTSDDGATWTQVAKLVASDGAAYDYFGGAVAIDGDVIVVGAYTDDDAGYNAGSAYIFKTSDDGATWTQTSKLVAGDADIQRYMNAQGIHQLLRITTPFALC